jgi:CheY-like chemotaxis protein/pSer/pThr/pTyr-binding forkhead associated (FHA) protein
MSAALNDNEWSIELGIEGFDPFRISITTGILLGRTQTDPTEFKIVDLTNYNAEERGVSRKHAVIRWQGPQLFLYDLDSANGTLLNGTRLQANVGYRLSEGDTIHLGHMPIKIRLNSSVGQSTIRARRFEIDVNSQPAVARGQRVLIVEDESSISALYKTALEAAGYTIQIVKDVVGAMRVLAQVSPSALLLDLMLPGVHGLELARYIRRDADGAKMPIIVSSAITDPQTIKAAIDDGVDVYMTKPSNIKELVRVVGALVTQNEQKNPGGTKLLKGTASLESIEAAPRNDTVVIFVDEHREPIGAIVQPYLTLGRNVSTAPARTHVDLEPFGAFDKGVSRIHARIKRMNKGFFLEDMESSNGTFLNGHSLATGESPEIHSGDEMRLGDLRLRIYLLAETK